MKVYLCYILKNHRYIVAKVISEYEASRKWQHKRTEAIIKMEKLIARYYLAKSEKEKSKTFKAWNDFARKNNLGLHEERNQHYIHTWEVDKDHEIKELFA